MERRERDGGGGAERGFVHREDRCVLFFLVFAAHSELLRQKSVCRRESPPWSLVSRFPFFLSRFSSFSLARTLSVHERASAPRARARAHTRTHTEVATTPAATGTRVFAAACSSSVTVCISVYPSRSFGSPSPRLDRKVPVSRRRSSRAHSRYVVVIS